MNYFVIFLLGFRHICVHLVMFNDFRAEIGAKAVLVQQILVKSEQMIFS